MRGQWGWGMAQEAWQEPGVWRLPPTHPPSALCCLHSLCHTHTHGYTSTPRDKGHMHTWNLSLPLSSKPGTEAQSGSSVLELWDLSNFPIPSPFEDVLLKETTAPTPSS